MPLGENWRCERRGELIHHKSSVPPGEGMGARALEMPVAVCTVSALRLKSRRSSRVLRTLDMSYNLSMAMQPKGTSKRKEKSASKWEIC